MVSTEFKGLLEERRTKTSWENEGGFVTYIEKKETHYLVQFGIQKGLRKVTLRLKEEVPGP